MRAVGHAVRREDSGSETFLKNRTHAVRGYRTHETHTRRTRDERLGPDQRFADAYEGDRVQWRGWGSTSARVFARLRRDWRVQEPRRPAVDVGLTYLYLVRATGLLQ